MKIILITGGAGFIAHHLIDQIIADAQNKPLNYELVDYHTSRPGHDLRYALCGDKMKSLGFEPQKSVEQRIAQVVQWTLDNSRWLNA